MDIEEIKSSSKERLKRRLKDLDPNDDPWEHDQVRHELLQRHGELD